MNEEFEKICQQVEKSSGLNKKLMQALKPALLALFQAGQQSERAKCAEIAEEMMNSAEKTYGVAESVGAAMTLKAIRKRGNDE